MSEEQQPVRKMAWVDTETTGLHPKDGYRVIDLAVVVTDENLNILDEFETKIKLSAADKAAFHPKAMLANGYTDEEWHDAPENSRSIWERVSSMTKGLVMCGQNVDFDRTFLEAEMKRFGIRPQWDRRIGDVMLLSMRVFHTSSLANMKLENVYPELGGPKLPPHRAMPDVIRAMYLYWKLLSTKDGRSPPGSAASFEALMKRIALPEQLQSVVGEMPMEVPC